MHQSDGYHTIDFPSKHIIISCGKLDIWVYLLNSHVMSGNMPFEDLK